MNRCFPRQARRRTQQGQVDRMTNGIPCTISRHAHTVRHRSPMPEDFHFLLLPGFSALGFMSALEPLRVANRFHAQRYRWHLLSVDGAPVAASNGIPVATDAACADVDRIDTLFVVAGFDPLASHTRALADWLRHHHRRDARRHRHRQLHTRRGTPARSVASGHAALGSARRVPRTLSAPHRDAGPVRDRRAAHHLRGRHRVDRHDARPDRSPARRGSRGDDLRAVRRQPDPATLGQPAARNRRALRRA
ncbi:protein of unknown function [Burkholderia multivorans]